MTPEEFSNTFDIILNSYGVDLQIYKLDEYEKSVLLTEAQEQLVVELYTGRNDKERTSFEASEELRSNLRSLVRTETLTESTDNNNKGLSEYSKFYTLPKGVLFITYEYAYLDDKKAGCFNGKTIEVIPTTQDEFHRIMKNPFKQANKKRALRLDAGNKTIEIVSKFNIKDYTIRYLSKPTPIVTANLDGLSIDGISTPNECKLDSALHRPIIEKAVMLALVTRSRQK